MFDLLRCFKRLTLSAVRLFAPVVVAGAVMGAGGAAMAADLQVSEYLWSPDPVANGAQASFTIRVTNLGPGAVNDAVVSIAVPSHFTVQPGAFPSYCALSGVAGAQNLSCNLPALAAGGDFNFSYTAGAVTVGSRDTTASISSPTNVDGNAANNSLTVSPAVRSGADLSVIKDDNEPDDSIPGGGILTYTLNASNAGPDATAAIQVIDNLPAPGNFQFTSAGGAGWTCAHASSPVNPTVTCSYNGAALVGAFPPITITGRVLASGGAITNTAFARLTSPLILDPDTDNDASSVTTAIEPGADLEAKKSMPPSIIQGDTADITLTVAEPRLSDHRRGGRRRGCHYRYHPRRVRDRRHAERLPVVRSRGYLHHRASFDRPDPEFPHPRDGADSDAGNCGGGQ